MFEKSGNFFPLLVWSGRGVSTMRVSGGVRLIPPADARD